MSTKFKMQLFGILALFVLVIIFACSYTGKSPVVLLDDGILNSIQETSEQKAHEAAERLIDKLFYGI